MRTVTPQTLALLEADRGAELIIVLGIQWVKDGLIQLYSDQKINDQTQPTIIEVSNFDTIQTISSINDSQSLSVVLDDVDGKIKKLLDNNNVHKQMVSVYFLFKGLTLEHKTLFFCGEISSPIVWDEGGRTLGFDILSNRESVDVGFSMEEGDFSSIPDDALGQAWPLVFGQVCNMPTVQVRSPRKGILLNGEGIHDFTIEPRLCQARLIQCPAVSKGITEITERGPDNTYQTEEEQVWGPEPQCVVRRFEVICNLLGHQVQQMEHEHTTLNIRGGEDFPQGENVTINIGDARFRGTFSGTYFTVTDREHPAYANWDHIACHAVDDHSYGLKRVKGDIGNWKMTETNTAYTYIGEPITTEECENQESVSRESLGGPAASWAAYEEMSSADFHWCPAGTEVLLEDKAEILNIVSLLPGTVDSVAAYYSMPTGRQLLMEVPTNYYTVYNTNYQGYDVVEIGLEKYLSLYDENWDDKLYVSFTSTIGPNPIDIIEWLVGKYTDYNIDTPSFTNVKAALTKYPCNFWLTERMSVYDLIQDIAYQSRCGVYIRSGVIYVKYLAVEPSAVRTWTENDIHANTLRIKLTESENLVTKQEITWSKTGAGVQYSDKTDLSFTLKHNITRYGVLEDHRNYYTQNTYSTILKSATFWQIRNANSWKLVEFDTPLTQLNIDIWDCIQLSTSKFTAKCLITQIQYNWENNSIHFEAWTPIKAGETTPYIWAWPANQNALATFPTPDDEDQGAGYDFKITPPIDHLLRGGFEATESLTITGDRHPSDLDDTMPSITCEISDLVDLDDVYEADDYEIELAKATAQTQMNAAMAPDGRAGTDEKKKPQYVCGMPSVDAGNVYEVIVHYITADLVTIGGGNCAGGPCASPRSGGNICTGTASQFCHAFGAMFSAWTFYLQKKAEIGIGEEPYCGRRITGKTYVNNVSKPRCIKSTGPLAGPCEELPGDPEALNQGAQYEPGTF